MERMYIIVQHNASFTAAARDCWQAVQATVATIEPDARRRWQMTGAGKIALRARPSQWKTLTDEIPSVTVGCVRVYQPVAAPDARFRKLQAHSPATDLTLPDDVGDVDVILNNSLDLSSGKWIAHIGHAAAATDVPAPTFQWAPEKYLRAQEGGTLIQDAGHTEVDPGTPTVWIAS